ncbi:MAG: hypothetical protein IJV15_14115 [Lachnospiraceae bacterium]|nr:hypothetical protein [Lachnospiraceae bacterium]
MKEDEILMSNRVKLKIGEIEFEAEGTEEIIDRERTVFLNSILPAAIEAMKKTQIIESSQGNEYIQDYIPQVIESKKDAGIEIENSFDFSRTNLITFINKYGNINDQDFVLFATYYDEKKNNTKYFTSENVKKYYSEARRQEYSNVSELLRKLLKKGFIMDAPDVEEKTPKPYVITNDGLEYVENYEPKEKNTQKRKNKSKNTKVKIDSIYSNINADDLKLNKYPELKAFGKFKDKMILTMYICTIEGIGDYFSVYDIECLMVDIMGFSVTRGQINGVFKNNKTWFKSEDDENNPKVKKRKLLQGGKDYAQLLIDEQKN